MTVASKRIANAIPMPIILIADTPLVIKAAKLTASTKAAAVIMRADFWSPIATASLFDFQ